MRGAPPSDPASELLVGRESRGLLPRGLHQLYWSVCARWWDAYRTSGVGRDLLPLILAAFARHGLHPGQRILDVGCGTGGLSLDLADAGYSVVGVDYARGMLRRARAKVPPTHHRRLRFARLDFEAGMPFRSESFDCVLCIAALHCAVEPVRLLREIARTLRPSGLCVLLLVGTRPGSDQRRTLPGRIFHLLRTLPGWRRRVQIRTRPALGPLLGEGGFDTVEERPVASHLLLVARRRSRPTTNGSA